MWLKSLVKPEYRGHLDARMGWYIIIGSLPIVVLGIFLKDTIETDFRSLWLIATMLIVMGVVLGIADRVGSRDRTIKQMNIRHAGLLGAAQALALVPGVSRSGATLSMGRFLGYDREAATRYAFLLAIPAVVGAGLFELKEIPGGDNTYGWGPTIVATVVSFVVGYAAIAWLLRYVTTRSYLPFVIYRICLGSLVLVLLATGVHRRLTRLGPGHSQPERLKKNHSAGRGTDHQGQRERVAVVPARARACARSSCRRRRRSGSAPRPGRPRPRSCACPRSAAPRSGPGGRRRPWTAASRGCRRPRRRGRGGRRRRGRTGRPPARCRAPWPTAKRRIGSSQRHHRPAYLRDLALEGVDPRPSRWCGRGRRPTPPPRRRRPAATPPPRS